MSLKTESLEKFKSVVTGITGDLVIVIAQVDPDAIAASLGLKEIVEHLRPELSNRIRLVYCGYLSHPQNRFLVNRFDLKRWLMEVGDFKPNPDNVDTFALVDSSLMNESRLPESFRLISPAIIIDHHQISPTVKQTLKENNRIGFLWSETTEVGAASTMIVELATALSVNFTPQENLLLGVGIHTDTKALADGHRRDREAFGLVSKTFSGPEFSTLIRYPLPVSFYDNFSYALSHKTKSSSGRLVANAGRVQADDADDISTIAEELMRMDGTTLVVVFGLVGQSVRISARSNNPTLALDEFLKRCFGQNNAGAKITQDGRGEGGAMIKLDLGLWMSDGVRAEAEALLCARIKELIFAPEKE